MSSNDRRAEEPARPANTKKSRLPRWIAVVLTAAGALSAGLETWMLIAMPARGSVFWLIIALLAVTFGIAELILGRDRPAPPEGK